MSLAGGTAALRYKEFNKKLEKTRGSKVQMIGSVRNILIPEEFIAFKHEILDHRFCKNCKITSVGIFKRN